MSVDVGSAIGYLDLDITGFLNGLRTAQSEANTSASKLETVGKKFVAVGDKIAGVGTKLTTVITAPLAGAVTAVIKSYAEMEQAIGGVETLFKGNAADVIANAETAYKRAGTSATDYMEQVTSFSASLLQSVGGDTKQAAKVADMAMVDMSDNANKFGTNIENIQNAYQGFAKQNYTMLDNLKLGYGGTKAEMERLLEDAGKLTGIKYDVSNLDDVYTAVHVIQEEMGVTGTTALEATETISGSFGMAKAAISDFLANLGKPGADMETFKANMVESITVVVKNIKKVLATIWENIPLKGWQKNLIAAAAAAGPLLLVVGKLTSGIGTIIKAFRKIPAAIRKAKGALVAIKAAIAGISAPVVAVVAIIAVLVAAFVNLWKTNKEFRNKITEIWNQVKASFEKLTSGIVERLNSLGFDFKSITDVLKSVWEGFCNLLAPLFEGAFQLVADVFDFITNQILNALDFWIAIFKGDWQGAWDAVKATFENVWNLIVNIFTTIGNTLLGVLDAVCGLFDTTWSETWNNIKTFFQNLWNGIVTWFKNTLNNISTFFQNVWNGISTFFTNIWNTIKTTVTNAANAVSTTLTNIWNRIKTNVTNAWNNVKTTIVNVWNSIKTSITNVTNSIKTTLTNVWNTIKTNITNTTNAIKTVIDTIFNAIKTVIANVLTAISTTVSTKWNTIKTTISNVINSIKTTIGSIWNAIKATTTTVWNAIKTAITVPINAAKNTISNIINTIKSVFTSGFNAAKTTVTSIFNSIKSKITSVMNSAKNIVSGAIDKIKGFFDFTWSLPKIAMPHFKITGSFSLNPPSVPSIGVEWYKKAMGGGMILDSPTIFGFNPKSGKFLAGGEAGSEAVVGTKSLMHMIKTAVNESNTKIIETITGYFDVILDNIKSSNEKLLYSIGYLVTASYQFAQACEDLSYIAYNGFVKSEQAIIESNRNKPVESGGDTYNFYSNKSISEVEAARQLKKAKRDMAEGF